MKKILGILALALGVTSQAQALVNCEINCNGNWITGSGGYEYQVRQDVALECQNSLDYVTHATPSQYYVDAVSCSGGSYNPPYNPPSYGAQISVYRQQCYSDLCTYQVSWNSSYSTSTVLTVQIPGETQEVLMACEGSHGSATASWVAPGKTYVFRVYQSSQCTADISYHQSPAAVKTIVGGQY